MEEKKNIRELAIQYFEGRILRKDEKLLFAYVGQSEENRATFRQWKRSGLHQAFQIPEQSENGKFCSARFALKKLLSRCLLFQTSGHPYGGKLLRLRLS